MTGRKEEVRIPSFSVGLQLSCYRSQPLHTVTRLVTYQVLSGLLVYVGVQCCRPLTVCLLISYHLCSISLPHIAASSFQPQVLDRPFCISVSLCGLKERKSMSFILCISHGEAAALSLLIYLSHQSPSAKHALSLWYHFKHNTK